MRYLHAWVLLLTSLDLIKANELPDANNVPDANVSQVVAFPDANVPRVERVPQSVVVRPVVRIATTPGVVVPQPFRNALTPRVSTFRQSGYDPDHTCNNCGRSQYVISGRGPVAGTHTHTCYRCGNTWYH